MSHKEQPTLTPEYIVAAIDRLEREYKISSVEFTEARSIGEELGIHEDDIAEWEYLVQAKSEVEDFLRESYFRTAHDSDRENVASHRYALAA